jgi:guanylate kinase
MTAKGKIFILSGPSGSGKTTLYKRLLEAAGLKKNIKKIVSATTRQPRPGEKHGRDYFFLSPRMFAYKKRAGHFLEAQKVFDQYYGTPRKSVLDTLRRSKNVLLCIDVNGAKNVKARFPDAVSIFIKTPDFQNLKERLVKRGSEKDATIKMRLETARKELREAGGYDYVLVNRDLDECYARLEAVVRKESEKV